MAGLTSMRRKGLASNFSRLSASTTIQSVLGFITVVYLARILGPKVYGLYNYTWTLPLLFLIITQLGIPTWVTRQAASLKDVERTQRVQDAWNIMFWLGIMTTMGFIGMTIVLPMPALTKTLLLLWSSLLLQNSINPLWIYALDEQLTIPAIGIIIGAALRLIGTVFLVRTQGQITLAIVIAMTALWIALIGSIGYLVLHHRLKLPRWPGWKAIGITIRHSRVFASLGAVSVLYSGIDIIILRHFSTLTQVGFYSVAQRPIVFLWSFVVSFLHTFYPVAGRMAQENIQKLEHLTANILRMVLIVIVPIVIGTLVVAKPVIISLFGKPYQASAVPLMLLVVAWALSAIREVFAISLLSTFGEKLYLRGVLIGGIVNLLAMLGFVRWGATGLALALALSQGFVMIYTGWALRRKFRRIVFPWKTGGIAVFNSLVMAFIVYKLLPFSSVWVIIGIGIVVFAGLAVITRLLTWADILAIMHS